ncbi:MAG TPA: hypothetical protein VGO58_19515 [Chitinophagaceae bacterium]|nr:hypothetical protein [Chitinophagaceae bacterium]
MLLLGGVACNSPQKREGKENVPPVNRTMYKDIDPYTLAGVDEIKDPSAYPYIMIEEENDKKKIVYMITRADSAVTLYEKKDAAWTMDYLEKADTGSQKTYEYILPDRVIELTYHGTSDETGFHLFKASVMKGDTIKTYYSRVGEKPVIVPGPGAVDSIKESTPVVMMEKMDLLGDVLRIVVTHFNKTQNRISYTDTSCFSGGKRSWFWFRHFVPRAVSCR